MSFNEVEEQWLQNTTPYALRGFFNQIDDQSPAGLDGTRKWQLIRTNGIDFEQLSRQLSDYQYRFAPYRLVALSKGPSKFPRTISIATIRDRLVLKAMQKTLVSVDHSLRSRLPQHLVRDLIDVNRNAQYQCFLKLDIKNFYPSIDHNLLLRELHTTLNLEFLEAFFKKAIFNRSSLQGRRSSSEEIEVEGIPQGLSISNALSELALKPFDEAMQSIEGCYFTRYVDDCVVLGKDKSAIDRAYSTAQVSLENLKLTLHEEQGSAEKSSRGKFSKESPLPFLGYEFRDSSRVSVRTQSVDRLRQRLLTLFTAYKYSSPNQGSLEELIWRINLTVSGCRFNGQRYGWLPYFSYMNDYALLRRLDKFVHTLCGRYHVPIEHCRRIKKFSDYLGDAKRQFPDPNRVPYFDDYSFNEQKELLARYFHIAESAIDNMDEREVSKQFTSKIRATIRQLEHDVGQIS